MNNWYEHPSILKSWLAEQLYGSRSTTHTSTISRKMKSGKWSANELAALDAARKSVVECLQGDDNFIDHLVNAFGNPNFNADEVIELLNGVISTMQENGGNAGSLLTLVNILAEIDHEAKNRY
jgi:hypothetical protein